MARSIQSVKIILDRTATAIARRGFAATAAEGVAKASSGAALKRLAVVEKKAKSVHKVSWGPDPKTGCYKPEGAGAEIDVAELRKALLKHSN